MERLKEAASKVFRGYTEKRRHIYGILIADLGGYVREISASGTGARAANGPFGAIFSCRLISNPGYIGAPILERLIDDPLDVLAEHFVPGRS